MESAEELLQRLGQSPKGVRLADLANICDRFFGEPWQKGGRHRVYRTPRPGDPRVNIQNDKGKGKAKAYQVGQVMRAIKRLERMK